MRAPLSLLTELDAFFTDYHLCSELDAGRRGADRVDRVRLRGLAVLPAAQARAEADCPGIRPIASRVAARWHNSKTHGVGCCGKATEDCHEAPGIARSSWRSGDVVAADGSCPTDDITRRG